MNRIPSTDRIEPIDRDLTDQEWRTIFAAPGITPDLIRHFTAMRKAGVQGVSLSTLGPIGRYGQKLDYLDRCHYPRSSNDVRAGMNRFLAQADLCFRVFHVTHFEGAPLRMYPMPERKSALAA